MFIENDKNLEGSYIFIWLRRYRNEYKLIQSTQSTTDI